LLVTPAQHAQHLLVLIAAADAGIDAQVPMLADVNALLTARLTDTLGTWGAVNGTRLDLDVSLILEALVRYDSRYHDPRIAPALQAALLAMFKTTWNPHTGIFNGATNGPSDNGALVAAAAWVYVQLHDTYAQAEAVAALNAMLTVAPVNLFAHRWRDVNFINMLGQ
jgi:hypothetical protein